LLDASSALIAAARLLLPDLKRGRAINAKALRKVAALLPLHTRR
jgi:hypothetical protein